MIRALFKKQMMESFSWLYFSRRTGKKHSAGGIAAYTCMYLVIFGMLGSLFYTMAEALCRPLSEVGLGWLYFAIVSLVAVIFGVFGSAFNTFASLYKAKDNDLLFSMPIPASKILLTRLSGVYASRRKSAFHADLHRDHRGCLRPGLFRFIHKIHPAGERK